MVFEAEWSLDIQKITLTILIFPPLFPLTLYVFDFYLFISLLLRDQTEIKMTNQVPSREY